MNFAQLARIRRRRGGDYFGAEVADALQFRREVDCLLPVDDLIRDFSADSLDGAELASARTKNFVGRLKNLALTFRRRTGPIVGSMLSAMHASVAFMSPSDNIINMSS